jgi:hypothetical protein
VQNEVNINHRLSVPLQPLMLLRAPYRRALCSGALGIPVQVLREIFFRAPSLGSKGLNRSIVTGKTKHPFFVSLMLQVAIIGVHWVCVPVQTA